MTHVNAADSGGVLSMLSNYAKDFIGGPVKQIDNSKGGDYDILVKKSDIRKAKTKTTPNLLQVKVFEEDQKNNSNNILLQKNGGGKSSYVIKDAVSDDEISTEYDSDSDEIGKKNNAAEKKKGAGKKKGDRWSKEMVKKKIGLSAINEVNATLEASQINKNQNSNDLTNVKIDDNHFDQQQSANKRSLKKEYDIIGATEYTKMIYLLPIISQDDDGSIVYPVSKNELYKSFDIYTNILTTIPNGKKKDEILSLIDGLQRILDEYKQLAATKDEKSKKSSDQLLFKHISNYFMRIDSDMKKSFPLEYIQHRVNEINSLLLKKKDLTKKKRETNIERAFAIAKDICSIPKNGILADKIKIANIKEINKTIQTKHTKYSNIKFKNTNQLWDEFISVLRSLQNTSLKHNAVNTINLLFNSMYEVVKKAEKKVVKQKKTITAVSKRNHKQPIIKSNNSESEEEIKLLQAELKKTTTQMKRITSSNKKMMNEYTALRDGIRKALKEHVNPDHNQNDIQKNTVNALTELKKCKDILIKITGQEKYDTNTLEQATDKVEKFSSNL